MAIQVLNCEKTIPIVTTGAVTVNTMALHQGVIGVYMASASGSGTTVPFCIKGRISGVKKKAGTGLTWTAGQKLYWDDSTAKNFKTTATSASTLCNVPIAGAAAIASDTTGTVELL